MPTSKFIQTKNILFFLIVFTLFACSKSDTTNPVNENNESIQGTWVFTKETSTTAWNWSAAHDSIIISFDNAGKYRYTQYSLPVDKGSFSVVRDSILKINFGTDTSAFLHSHTIWLSAHHLTPLIITLTINMSFGSRMLTN